jgi:hypothetical protein
MTRYLVVAHETATSPKLLGAAKAIAAEDPEAQFVLLVPTTPVKHLLFHRSSDTDAEAVARKRVEEARAAFVASGVPLVDARLGPPDPLAAIEQEVRTHPDYAGFVISTLPAERSRWLRTHLPDKVRERYGLPVHQVEMPVGDLAQRMLP